MRANTRWTIVRRTGQAIADTRWRYVSRACVNPVGVGNTIPGGFTGVRFP
ncbi:MAG: hypothetical protein SWY16_22585 [Cyanobacteriota bacterium]|nr:hypothetical protein [Cyanobacteriota bacterium]